MSAIATVDISRWYAGGAEADAVAAEVDEGLQRAGFILVTGHGVDTGPGRARCARPVASSSRCPTRSSSATRVPVGGHGWIGPGRRGQRLRRGHRDAARPQGELQPGCRDRDRRPRRRPNLVRAQRLAGRGARRCRRWSTSTPPRCAGSPTTCWRCSPTRWACRPTRWRRWRPAHLDDEHQPLPARERGRRARARASSASARTPTSAPSPCSIASREPVGCRCIRRPAAGRTPRTTPAR